MTRFSPPGAAAEDQRRLTCQASLQQSDGLFQAARSVSVAAAPLPIFYALSQGGRAIAAAARAAKGEQWKLNGHGIKAKALDGPLTAVSVATDQPGRPGSFVRLTELIGLPVWGRDVEVPFGESMGRPAAERAGHPRARRRPLRAQVPDRRDSCQPARPHPYPRCGHAERSARLAGRGAESSGRVAQAGNVADALIAERGRVPQKHSLAVDDAPTSSSIPRASARSKPFSTAPEVAGSEMGRT